MGLDEKVEFKIGDLVDSFGCDEGRFYMPGTGKIVTIKIGEERSFVCEHDGKLYYYARHEISITDLY